MLRKIKGDFMDVTRTTLPSTKLSKEQREKALKVLEEAKKSQVKKPVKIPQGFSPNFIKKKAS